LQELNPGSIVKFEVDAGGRFKRCCVVPHGGAVAAATSPRKVLVADGFHLKGPWNGVGLTYMATSAENNLVMTCLVICDVESAGNYEFGLNALLEHEQLGATLRNDIWVFMSDRNPGMLSAVATALPKAEQMFCGRHMAKNCPPLGQVGNVLFCQAARSPTAEAFKGYMDQIQQLVKPEIQRSCRGAAH
jgi:hypothetical protein